MAPDDEDNGILGRMSAVEIGAALQRLPDAASYQADEIQQWSTTPTLGGGAGRCRHTVKRQISRQPG